MRRKSKDPSEQPTLHLSEHTDLLLMHRIRPIQMHGDPERLLPYYKKVQRHCYLLGWWSPWGLFFFNPATIVFNQVNWRQYKKKYAAYMQMHGIPGNPVSPIR